jgi:hypothetical protein
VYRRRRGCTGSARGIRATSLETKSAREYCVKSQVTPLALPETCSLLPHRCAPCCASSKSITHGALRGTTPSSGGVRGVRDDRTDDPFRLASLSFSFPLPFPFPCPFPFTFPYPFGADVCLAPLSRYEDGASPCAAPGISWSNAPDEDRRDPAMDGLDREKRSRSRDMLEGREEELGLVESLSTTEMVMSRLRCRVRVATAPSGGCGGQSVSYRAFELRSSPQGEADHGRLGRTRCGVEDIGWYASGSEERGTHLLVRDRRTCLFASSQDSTASTQTRIGGRRRLIADRCLVSFISFWAAIGTNTVRFDAMWCDSMVMTGQATSC